MSCRSRSIGAACCLALSLCACGGGGGSSAPASPAPASARSSAEGLWLGTDSAGYSLAGVVMNTGAYWVAYYLNGIAYGFVQGTGTSGNGNFTSTDALQFDLASGTAISATVSASYVPQSSFHGTFTPSMGGAAPVTFTTRYDASYDAAATTAAVQGLWQGTLATGESFSVNVGATGAFTGSGSSGCAFSGSLTPDAGGKDVYDLALAFQGGVCLLGTQALSGVAVMSGTAASPGLIAAATNPARSAAFLGIMTH